MQAHGVRVTADGWLLVPLRDAAGKLWNVQRIAPAKPQDGGPDKLFLKGGRKSGLWHMLGSVEPAPEAASGAADDQARAFDPFTVDDSGVWHHGIDQDGGGRAWAHAAAAPPWQARHAGRV